MTRRFEDLDAAPDAKRKVDAWLRSAVVGVALARSRIRVRIQPPGVVYDKAGHLAQKPPEDNPRFEYPDRAWWESEPTSQSPAESATAQVCLAGCMRIAVVHSFYRSESPSGENEAVEAQASVLEAAGHEVVVVSRRTDEESRSGIFRARSAVRVITGRGSDPLRELQRFRPDLVHVHNLFPNLGTKWVWRWDGPLVHTLHNFRPLCANGLLFRDGATCTLCPDGRPLAAIRYACYHQSRIQSVPLAARNSRGLRNNDLLARADAIIALSRRARDLYAHYGADPARLEIVPNGIEALAGARDPLARTPRWAAVGRLSAEKGFAGLMSIWPRGARLDLYGDGPDRDLIARIAPPSVKLMGRIDRDSLRRRMSGYSGLIFPSPCLEMSPLVVIEALEGGIPIISAEGTSAADTIREYRVGYTFTDHTSLLAAFDLVIEGGDALRARCATAFQDHFCVDVWRAALERVYAKVSR